MKSLPYYSLDGLQKAYLPGILVVPLQLMLLHSLQVDYYVWSTICNSSTRVHLDCKSSSCLYLSLRQ